MTPQEKAKELVNKFHAYAYCTADGNQDEDAKVCALLCVDEIVNLLYSIRKSEYVTFIHGEGDWKEGDDELDYWKEVKNEIDKL